LNSRVYTIVGDGECDEGLIWESAMSAANFELDNFILIVDRNGLQYDGTTTEVMNQIDLSKKFASFGFETTIVDGHNVEDLVRALNRRSVQPQCIIADTVKGKGVSFMEGVKEWHHHTLTEEEFLRAREEVENV
jgi:transketolase